MNNSTVNLDSVMSTMTQYACFGSATILSNCIILFVLFQNVKLFKKSAFIFGLAVGDLLDGVALTITGVVRVKYALEGSFGDSVHPSYCMKTLVTPIFLLGNQIPGAMFLLVGLERLTAVHFFKWYYTGWSYKFSWILTAIVYLFCLISLSVAFVITFFTFETDCLISSFCLTSNVVGPVYLVYNYGVSIVGGMVASVTTLIAMITFTIRKNKLRACCNVSSTIQSHVKDQWYVSRLMLCLSVMDLGLVVVPNITVQLYKIGSVQALSLELVCLRSMLNILVYIMANSEFRSSLLKIFCRRKMTSTVVPIVPTVPTVRRRGQLSSIENECHF